jgi:hypothetical protein
MLNLGEKNRNWLAKKMKSSHGRTVTYQRGESSISVVARFARIDTTIDESSGLEVRTCDQAWLIDAADLEIDGVATKPTRGDRIIIGDASDGKVYEVAAVPGLDCWRWSDSYQKTYHIHTKSIGTAPLTE